MKRTRSLLLAIIALSLTACEREKDAAPEQAFLQPQQAVLALTKKTEGLEFRIKQLETQKKTTSPELLEVYLHQEIEEKISPWKLDVVPAVFISADDKSLVVSLTTSNTVELEAEPSNETKDRYVRAIQGIVDHVLAQFDVTGRYRVTVQFVL